MNPAFDGGVVRGPHVYVKRADGSSGYEPVPEEVKETPKPEPESKSKGASWGTAKTAK
jgi:hypothetical protein